MPGNQLLTILALHYGAVLIHWVQRELPQVKEQKQHQFGLPLNKEVCFVGYRIGVSLEKMRFQLWVGQPLHASKALVPTTFVYRED